VSSEQPQYLVSETSLSARLATCWQIIASVTQRGHIHFCRPQSAVLTMSVSAWDNFLGTDWTRYSQIATKATCVGCGVIGVLTIMSQVGFLLGVWILCASVFLAVLEYPNVFVFVPNFDRHREFLTENLLMKLDEVKAIACFSFSLFCFMSPSITILAGLALMGTAVLLAFSAVNRRVDAADHAAAQGAIPVNFSSVNDQQTGFLSGAQNKFQYQQVQTAEGTINPHTGMPTVVQQHKQGVVVGSYQNA
jgi:hypothetical protein